MTKFNPVKKKNYEENADLKTMSDYALILEHLNGYSKKEARKYAEESGGEPLLEALRRRNIELFKTGDIILID
jgi:hypothetical protein